jgi:hypothetical protein
MHFCMCTHLLSPVYMSDNTVKICSYAIFQKWTNNKIRVKMCKSDTDNCNGTVSKKLMEGATEKAYIFFTQVS